MSCSVRIEIASAPARCLEHGVAVAAQDAGGDVAHRILVLDDQDGLAVAASEDRARLGSRACDRIVGRREVDLDRGADALLRVAGPRCHRPR